MSLSNPGYFNGITEHKHLNLYRSQKYLSRVDTNKTIITPIIRTLRPIKDHQTAIEQQSDPLSNVTKASDIFLTHGDYDIVQHIIPINKSVLQEIFAIYRKEDEFKYSHNKS